MQIEHLFKENEAGTPATPAPSIVILPQPEPPAIDKVIIILIVLL
jgi:hypothetical protein